MQTPASYYTISGLFASRRSITLKQINTLKKAFVSIGIVFVALFSQEGAGQSVRINEFMAANAGTLQDEDGESSDWVELFNASAQPVNLVGWGLTDDVDEPFKWVIPELTLAPENHAVIFASGKDRGVSTLAWETVIDWGDVWRYHVGTTEPSADWLLPGFDASAWAEGASGFGYGDDDDATEVEVTMAVFVRKTFSVASADAIASVLLDVDYDDAFVAYLNGVEIARVNIGLSGVRPAFDAPAITPIEPAIVFGGEPTRFEVEDFQSLLVEGENLLAIEVHNASLNSSDLTLIPFLTLGYETPPGNIGDVSEHIRPPQGSELHTSFQLSKAGEYLALIRPDGSIATEFAPAYPQQEDNVSYGYDQGSDEVGYLATPTPGQANASRIEGFVEAPVFSVDHGFFESPFLVTLRSATPQATIRYTLDGSAPTALNGEDYNSPLNIEQTTVLRAAAFKSGFEDSPVTTQSYFFLEDIAGQSIGVGPPPGWPRSWGSNVVDYGMDLSIVGLTGSEKREAVKEALADLPSISLVLDLDDLFDSDTGIYANAFGRGRNWERPASVELMFVDGTEGFQIDAGLRIRGGFSRSENNPKHAFRLFFRDEILNYPMFGDEGVDEFENLDLRTSQNYSWSFNGDGRNTMNRDVFSRDTQRDMGMPYTRSRYYHLYLNGQYWGLFQSQERAEASFGASYFGGNKDDFDVLKSTGPTDGFYDIEATDGSTDVWGDLWSTVNDLADAASEEDAHAIYMELQGLNPDGTRNIDFPVLLDVDNLIHYMLIVFYTGNFDAPISAFLGNEQINNFYTLKDRNAAEGFRFFTHDNEHTLLPEASQGFNRTGPYPAGSTFQESNPQWIHQQLMHSAEYRMRFADIAQKHLNNDGALTTAASTQRFLTRADEIEKAILAESARWGDSKRDDPLTKDDWSQALAVIRDNFFPGRAEEIIEQLTRTRTYDDWRATSFVTNPLPLFPEVAPPDFVQHGGTVDAGFMFSLVSAADSVYFTLDGSDPRAIGGGIAAGAQRYAAGFPLNQTVTVQARAIENGIWSALSQAQFYVDAQPAQTDAIIISEIHYNPYDPVPEELANGFADNDDFEFIELHNPGSEKVSLAGVAFTDGISFQFISQEIEAGDYLVLVRDAAAFSFRYGAEVPIAGVYAGRLSNSGEQVVLSKLGASRPLDQVTYQTGGSWPDRADGAGSSLVRMDNAAMVDAQWVASNAFNGLPGAGVLEEGAIIINEILAHTDLPEVDAIELYNTSNNPVDVSGWYLSDSQDYLKFQIPAGTQIAPGGYLVFDESDFNDPTSATRFALDSARGEEVTLVAINGNGMPAAFSDQVSFGATANGESLGRLDGHAGLYPLITPSLGSENETVRIGPVVISEIMYHPPNNDRFMEYIEVVNGGTEQISLDNWRLDEAVTFDFPAGLSLDPGGIVRIVPFDPSTEQDKIDALMATVIQDTPMTLLGPWEGRLNNAGEEILLLRPDTPPADAPDLIPMIEVDRVTYAGEPPWPDGANGTGAALVRVDPASFSDDPKNWTTQSRTVPVAPPIGPIDSFVLTDPFPNPTSQSVAFSLALENTEFVTAKLFDVLGREVRLVHRATLRADEQHLFSMDVGNLAGGVYFLQIVADSFATSKSFVILP